MPVDQPSHEYREHTDDWGTVRDVYAGEKAVKGGGERYLPSLDSHRLDRRGYSSYLDRAVFYNAFARTVDGLAGSIFQKEPTMLASEEVLNHLEDITLADETAEMFALSGAREVLTVGRHGILVDMPLRAHNRSVRPYWVHYAAEDIFSYRVESVGGDAELTRVVLCESVTDAPGGDPFDEKNVVQYRVLELVDGVYTVTVFRKNQSNQWLPISLGPDPDADPTVVPDRRRQPLGFIPFVFLGPDSVSPAISKPPLLDLARMNLSHYRTMADLEHGRHFVALPTPYITGAKPEGNKLRVGAGAALVLEDSAAKIGMLEFTGAGLGALEAADRQKRHLMAVLGARMLEEQPATSQAETAFAVNMRHAGEQATLRTLAGALEQGLTRALQIHQWWLEPPGSLTRTPADTGARFALNKDFSTTRMPPEELRALVEAYRQGAMSFETFYFNVTRGDLGRPGVGVTEELADVQRTTTETTET